jgi:hypothetical protein
MNGRFGPIKICFSRMDSFFILFICTMNKFTRAVFRLFFIVYLLVIIGLNQEDIIRFSSKFGLLSLSSVDDYWAGFTFANFFF